MTQSLIKRTTPTVKIDGNPATPDVLGALVSVEIDRALNLVGRATLRFLETSYDLRIQSKLALGKDVEIGVMDGPMLFKGAVTGFSLDQDYERGTDLTLTVVVDDLGHKLARDTTHQAFLQSKYSDALSSIINAAGLIPSLQDTADVEEYILQSGLPLDFLNWVCSRFGLQWRVDGSTLTTEKVGTSSATVALDRAHDLLRLSTRASDRHPSKVTVTGWDPDQQAQVSGVATPTSTSAESGVVEMYPGRGDKPTGEITLAAQTLTAGEATKVSKSVLAQSVMSAITVRGTAWAAPDLKPGTTVELENAGSVSGSYFVSRVQHSYSTSGFVTHFTAGPPQPQSLVDLLGPGRASSSGFMGQLATGVVTNNHDSKGDHPGQVKVKLFVHGSGIESHWARVLTIGAGSSRGAVFHPEVNDEVLVGFENGDTRRPVVLGGLFSKRNALPSTDTVASGKVNYRRITSREGHTIELYDGASASEGYLELKTKGGHFVKVSEEKLELKTTDKPISISNGKATIELTAQGDVTIEGANITLKAQQAVKLQGAQVEAKADATAKLQGNIVEVKGGASGAIDGGGALTLKGGTVAIN